MTSSSSPPAAPALDGATQAAGPSPEILAPLPGWRIPPQMPGPGNPDQPSGEGTVTGGGGLDDEPGPASTAARSLPTGEFFKSKSKTFAAIAKTLLIAAGGLLNSHLQASADDETWLPDDDDQRDISEPLGRLAARRIPLPEKLANLTDVEDMAMLAVAAATYAAKGLAGWMNGRRERRRLRDAGTVKADGLQAAGRDG